MTPPSSSNEPHSLYDLLELDPGADDRAIKSAFRRMARAHHPDVNPEDPLAHERFIEITAAFEILSDPARRELYDEFGLEGLASDFDPVRARWQRRASPTQERDQDPWWQSHPEESWSARFKREYDVENSSFKSIFEKARRDFNPFQRAPQSQENETRKSASPAPRGEDVRVKHTLTLREAIQGGPIAIEHHDGSLLTINVPPGARDGEVLLIKAEGLPSPTPGGLPGDLVLTIHIDAESHPDLTRHGLDLTLQLPVTMPEAILGAKLKVPTPHGDCMMTLPEGLHSGAKLRLKEMGVWRDGERGDFYVIIQIHSPTRLDARIRQLARELAEGYPEDLRAKKNHRTS